MNRRIALLTLLIALALSITPAGQAQIQRGWTTATFIAFGDRPAIAGAIRLSNNTDITARNQDNSADSLMWRIDTDGRVETTSTLDINGGSGIHIFFSGSTPGNIGTRTGNRPTEVISASSMVTGMVIANTSMQLGGVDSNSTVVLFTPVAGTTGGSQGIIIQQADGTPAVFADLNGSAANGPMIYCSDCTIANPCAGAGSGAYAKRLNGVWICN